MDAGLPATWIITIACTTLATVATAVFVALGAYKIGKVAGKLKNGEGKAGAPVPVPRFAAPSMSKDEGAKPEKSSNSDDGDSDASTDEDESDEETEKKPRKAVKGTATGEKKKNKSKSKSKPKKVKDDDWEWPVYDEWWSEITYRMDRKLRAKEPKKGKSNAAPFEVTYEQKRGWPDVVTVTLRSKPLIQITRKCLSKQSEKFTVQEPKLNAKHLFTALSSLGETYQTIQEDDTSLAKYHLKHLIRFLETEYKDTIVQVERMGREKKVSWNLLWAFLHKGEKVYYTCQLTGQTLQGIVKFVHYYETMQGKQLACYLECCDYNGRKYVKCSTTIRVEEFKSERSFESIGICPMGLLEESEVAQMEAMFLHNGRKFYSIVSQGSFYMKYEGPRLQMVRVANCWQLKKQKADGRVMLDLLSFARMNPGYPLGNAEPPTCCSPQGLACGNTEMPSDEDLMLAPAVVYGFSFSNKQWGGFDVNGLSEIHFDDQAFDRDLVLTDPSRKQMLLALVTQYLRNPSYGDDDVPKLDPISNKGDGCIFLCYGPPGTGKTLTAESMAEKLHRPLWSISVFELGTTAKALEMNLIEILDIASQWRAVLLLDEADIYMEKRTSNGDPNRTAMTAIFLRLLEYYRGVLFLTTNRVASFDDAFCSRISMFLRYHRLEGAQREAVWSNLFARVGIDKPDLTPFTETRLNGREIRNTVRIAQTWAKSSEVELTTEHVLQVVNMLGEFRRDLEGAIQDESDERTITRALAKVRSMKGSDTEALNGHFVHVASTNDDEANDDEETNDDEEANDEEEAN